MTRSQRLVTWIISLSLLAITAGQSWQSFEISESAGGGVIPISGFLAFPVIGTLIALQVVIILVSMLVKPMVTRALTAAVLPFMIWCFVDVMLTSENQVQETLTRILAEQTGVFESPATTEFLVSSSSGVFPTLFLVSVVLNAFFLILMTLVQPKSSVARGPKPDRDLPEDLWSAQN